MFIIHLLLLVVVWVGGEGGWARYIRTYLFLHADWPVGTTAMFVPCKDVFPLNDLITIVFAVNSHTHTYILISIHCMCLLIFCRAGLFDSFNECVVDTGSHLVRTAVLLLISSLSVCIRMCNQ